MAVTDLANQSKNVKKKDNYNTGRQLWYKNKYKVREVVLLAINILRMISANLGSIQKVIFFKQHYLQHACIW